MHFRYSAAAQYALGAVWKELIEGGGDGPAWLEFYDGAMPRTTQRLLVRLYIRPHTMRVEPALAVRSGDASWGRIVGTNGRAVADFDVSTKTGGGYMVFNTVTLIKGGPVTVFGCMTGFSPPQQDHVNSTIAPDLELLFEPYESIFPPGRN
jgi:hypothetical protein